MNRFRRNSSPELGRPYSSADEQEQFYDDSALEGVAATVKLLLKLIQDHKVACDKGNNDGRRMLRVATMMTILDNVRKRIKLCQSFGDSSTETGLIRFNTTDVMKPSHVPREKRQVEQIVDEKERLRKQLNASLAARKSLEIMCSSLGKEKEIMAAELAKKVHELNEMDELINDLKVQNGTLLEQIQQCGSAHKDMRCVGGGDGGDDDGGGGGHIALHERNKALSEQLLRSLDGYRYTKRKLKEAQEENVAMRATLEEMGMNVSISLEHIRGFKERMASSENDPTEGIQEEITKLQHMIESLEMPNAKHGHQKGECFKPQGDISTCQPSVVA